jgi:type IV pilus assembly protein PilA
MRNIALNEVPQSRQRVVARDVLSHSTVGRGRSSGFTLVEMMVVVTIISILATLAMVGFRKITQSSHVSEATNMVQNIRVAQESYHSETQQYANISAGFPSGVGASSATLYPWQSVYGKVKGWGAACTGCISGIDWSVLPLHVDGPVIFGYATIAGGPASPFAQSVSVNGSPLSYTAPTVSDWYAIAAEADLDGNPATVTDVFSFSWSNQVFISNEGL